MDQSIGGEPGDRDPVTGSKGIHLNRTAVAGGRAVFNDRGGQFVGRPRDRRAGHRNAVCHDSADDRRHGVLNFRGSRECGNRRTRCVSRCVSRSDAEVDGGSRRQPAELQHMRCSHPAHRDHAAESRRQTVFDDGGRRFIRGPVDRRSCLCDAGHAGVDNGRR